MNAKEALLRLSFVGPARWLGDGATERKITHIRLKVESGVVYFKPFVASAEKPVAARARDVFEIGAREFGFDFSVVMELRDPLVARVHDHLVQRGWTPKLPYFVLHQGARGWLGITTEPLATAPVPSLPYVSLWRQRTENEATVDDVRRAIAKARAGLLTA